MNKRKSRSNLSLVVDTGTQEKDQSTEEDGEEHREEHHYHQCYHWYLWNINYLLGLLFDSKFGALKYLF